MSDDEGVMPFQEAEHASLEAVTPTRGKAALGAWRSQVGARTLRREYAVPRSGDESMSKPASGGVFAGQDLSHTAPGKAQRGHAKVRTGTGKSRLPGS